MEKEQIGIFRQRLLAERRQLLDLRATGAEASETVKLDQTAVGRLSRMDALQAQAMSQERGRRRELELQRIEAALRRCDTGDYGYCTGCDEPIDVRRLELDPAAALCIGCAARDDR